jgi:predicted DNA-binding transcriptional regulator AlpA
MLLALIGMAIVSAMSCGGKSVSDAALVFLISSEAADLLRISRRTLERMRVEGTGPRYLKVGPGKRSRVLYRQADVLAWLEAHSFGSTSEYGGRG